MLGCPGAPLTLTFGVVAWSMGLLLVLGTALAWLLARRPFAGRALLDALVTLPLVFPPIVLGYGLLLLLGRQGWLTQWLPPGLRPEIVFTQTGLVIAAFVAGLPLMVKPAQAAFAGIPPRLREAAALLGHRPWSVFWRIDVPLARRGVAAGLVLAGGRGLGEVGLSLMLGGNIAGRTETLSLAIYNHVMDGNLARANLLSLLLAGIAALAFFVLRRWGAL
ncbi:MAG: ABC transporter permease subunit [Proteobacteria bacterium]|nr:ABC transporter permease subunit [Pseudomonadota bacterium]MBS0494397.1 ABC transporter permease subunit [Pseudomonadota bacterium]